MCQSISNCPYTKQIAQEAAKEATRETFAQLGVDVDDPAQVEALRCGIRFGGAMQKAAGRAAFSIIGTIAGGLCIALWFGVKALMTMTKGGG